MTELWEAESKLDYPTLTKHVSIMSRSSKGVFIPTKLVPKILKLHKFRAKVNYLNCMRTLKRATYYSTQACLYLVRCAGKEIKATWDPKKQARYGNWEDGILYSKDRWSEMLELEGLEPFTSVGLRANVPVILKTSCLFIALAINIHWRVAGKQIQYRPSLIKHRGANLDALIGMRYSSTPNAMEVYRRIKRSCMPCRKQSKKTIIQSFGNIRASAVVPNNPFRICCLDLSGPWIVLKSKKGKDTYTNQTKVYVAVFGCLYSRMTHLEVIKEKKTESIISVLTKLSCVYGPPSCVTNNKGGTDI
jgi:hypothetical protein